MTINNDNIRIIYLKGCPIYQQLELEEALLRANNDNWCIINEGTPDAIVLGISSIPNQMIHLQRLKNKSIPIIKRFSGGGTVYVDSKTLFVTFICNKEDTHVDCYPEPILKWGEKIYRSVFKNNQFALIENDYVMGNKKVGGNALYIRKKRWLLHTSFLWDYDIEKINLLKHPAKVPEYRKNRPHSDFITPLSSFYSSPVPLIQRIPKVLLKNFTVEKTYHKIPHEFLKAKHRKSLQRIN